MRWYLTKLCFIPIQKCLDERGTICLSLPVVYGYSFSGFRILEGVAKVAYATLADGRQREPLAGSCSFPKTIGPKASTMESIAQFSGFAGFTRAAGGPR